MAASSRAARRHTLLKQQSHAIIGNTSIPSVREAAQAPQPGLKAVRAERPPRLDRLAYHGLTPQR